MSCEYERFKGEVFGKGFPFPFLHLKKRVDKTVAQTRIGVESWQKKTEVLLWLSNVFFHDPKKDSCEACNSVLQQKVAF